MKFPLFPARHADFWFGHLSQTSSLSVLSILTVKPPLARSPACLQLSKLTVISLFGRSYNRGDIDTTAREFEPLNRDWPGVTHEKAFHRSSNRYWCGLSQRAKSKSQC